MTDKDFKVNFVKIDQMKEGGNTYCNGNGHSLMYEVYQSRIQE